MKDSTDPYPGFTRHDLDGEHALYSGELPRELVLSEADFDALWELHPADCVAPNRWGMLVQTNRWQLTYGRDRRLGEERPVPPLLEGIQAWAFDAFGPLMNGLQINWYDLGQRHNIGTHRDSTANLVEGMPIVTISFGSPRPFVLRRCEGEGVHSVETRHGLVIVMPWDTNQTWSHEVPMPDEPLDGRRIAVTLRAFPLDS